MQKLIVKPFSKEALIENLRQQFPAYKIQTSLGSLQVRTSGFTVTGNVQIICDPINGKVSTRTNLDMVIVFFLFLFPLAVYLMINKDKIIRFEAEVVEGLKKILDPIGSSFNEDFTSHNGS